MPGVLAVYHAGGDDLGLAPFQSFPMLAETFNRPVFARDRVRFVGDIVAAVVAETAAQAVDAAEAIVVEIDPLPVVVSQAAALSAGRPAAVPRQRNQRVLRHRLRCGRATPSRGPRPWPRCRWSASASPGCPWRPTAASWCRPTEPAGITCWISHQAPHSVQPALAAVLGLEPESVRVVCPWVGGGFGPKAAVYVEYLVAAAAAMRLGRPVRVGGDPLGGHGGTRPRARLHHERQAGSHQRRQDRRARRQHRGLGGRLPGHRRGAARCSPR